MVNKKGDETTPKMAEELRSLSDLSLTARQNSCGFGKVVKPVVCSSVKWV